MKIAIESPDKLKDSDLEEIVDTWNRKSENLFSFNHYSTEFCVDFFAFSHTLKKIIGNLTSKGGRDFSKGGRMPAPRPPLNETLETDMLHGLHYKCSLC